MLHALFSCALSITFRQLDLPDGFWQALVPVDPALHAPNAYRFRRFVRTRSTLGIGPGLTLPLLLLRLRNILRCSPHTAETLGIAAPLDRGGVQHHPALHLRIAAVLNLLPAALGP